MENRLFDMSKLLDSFSGNPPSREDEIRLFTEGNLEELISRTMRVAVNFGHQIARGRLSESELISVVYIALTAAARNYHPEKQRFFPFAKAHIRFAIFKEFRARKSVIPEDATPEMIIDFDGKPIPKEIEHVDPDVDGIDCRDRWALLVGAIANLSQHDQEILSLSREGHSGAEIGRRVSLSRSVIQRRLARILKSLSRAARKFTE